MKQTAVEWLVEQINLGLSERGLISVIYQAKEMEKEQIIYAHVAGHNAPSSTIKNLDAEQYYNETFKQQEK